MDCKLRVPCASDSSFRGYIYLEAKGWSPKKCNDEIGGNKWCPAFGYTPENKWA
jgi:hypothetical protein